MARSPPAFALIDLKLGGESGLALIQPLRTLLVLLGERLRAGLDEVAGRHGFGLRQTGPAQMPLIMVDDDPTGAKGYFWNNALLKRGVYFHPWHNMFLSAAHTEADVQATVDAAAEVFKTL